jgi:hypothetical protein
MGFKTGPDCETITVIVRQTRTSTSSAGHVRAGNSHTEQLAASARTPRPCEDFQYAVKGGPYASRRGLSRRDGVRPLQADRRADRPH